MNTFHDFHRRFGVTEADLGAAKEARVVRGGFDDSDFPWCFSANVANAVVDFFVDQGRITQEQKGQFTLRDWATIIRADWFSHLVHKLAETSFGTYGPKEGISLEEYREGTFVEKRITQGIVGHDQPFFIYRERFQSREGRIYSAAILSGAAVAGLEARSNVEEVEGIFDGCPVISRSIRVNPKYFDNDPHFAALVARGTMRVRSRDARGVHLTQEQTAIDKTLVLFAQQLDDYDAKYGTPTVVTRANGKHKIVHRSRPPVDVLRWTSTNPISDRCPGRLGALAVN